MSGPKVTAYVLRVRQLEDEGLTTSDAQGVADLENLDDSEELVREVDYTEHRLRLMEGGL